MTPIHQNPLAVDLEHVLASTPAFTWSQLQNARIFITGGTGFFGTWLLESWAWACRHGVLSAKATVLARNPEYFLNDFPHLRNDPSIEFMKGDLLDFEFPTTPFTHILHAATPASVQLDKADPERMRSIIVEGTERVLSFARSLSAPPRLLMTSSGAVYGVQPPELTHVSEDYEPVPDAIPDSAYTRGKRDAEKLLLEASGKGVECIIARCFAFAGPHLPLDSHYAFGNFIRDARAGGPVRVGGDGTPFRSYLYAADLAAWLWTVLASGHPKRVYNVGSDQPVSIADLAQKIARYYGCGVQIAKPSLPGRVPARYVPSVERAHLELGLSVSISLEEAIARTERYLASRFRP